MLENLHQLPYSLMNDEDPLGQVHPVGAWQAVVRGSGGRPGTDCLLPSRRGQVLDHFFCISTVKTLFLHNLKILMNHFHASKLL